MIPAEAVEAAAKKLWRRGRVDPWEDARDYIAAEFREDARIAIEAAAPYMLGEAWKGGHDAGYIDGFDGSGITPNPYRPTE